MGTDLVNITHWWLLFFVVGVIAFPLTWLIFKRFVGIGYAFSKTIGFLIISYATFLLALFKIAPFTQTTLYVVSVSFATLNIYIFRKNKKEISSNILKDFRIILIQEILFIFGLLAWSLIRGFQPDIVGLEKLMDLGFINSILRSDYLPPVDMWFAGLPINYYWFGQFFVAVITKLSRIPSYITYNLMLATILGLSLSSAFALITTFVKNFKPKINLKIAIAAGLLSALLLNFGGNFHTPIYVLKDGPDKYWYPDATRFIGYNPDVNDKTIHEFPLYSYVVSDLHAHLINLPFVLLYITLLWRLLSKKKQRPIDLLPSGLVLGVMFMTSAWDFGNYLLLTGVSTFLFSLRKNGLKIKSIIETGVSVGTILIIGLMTVSPFLFNFESIAQGVDFVNARSRLWQLGVLWGMPAILTLVFISILFKSTSKFKKVKNIKTPDLFVASMLITSWILITLPEIIYVKDIYIASHHRANTMFKLTYQAFVMFYLSSGYIALRVLTFFKNKKRKTLAALYFVFIFGAVLVYPYYAIKSYYADLKNYRGLNGETWLENKYPDEYEVVLWFRENVSGQPTILEAPGDSYTDYNVISSYTGLPTVSGWFVHEWLWRGDSKFPQERVADIVQVYTNDDIELTKKLLQKYNVEYVIIGYFEREKYPKLNEEKLGQIGQQVFVSGNTSIYKLTNKQ